MLDGRHRSDEPNCLFLCCVNVPKSKMATKGCIVVTKYFLFVFNLIFFTETASIPLHLWSYVLSGLGTFTMLMGFLGCIGALKEVKCMLGIYFTFLVFLLASQITVGVLIYTQRNMIEKHLGLAVKGLIEKYEKDDGKSENLEESWDFIQFQFSCCGWNSSQEWMKNSFIKKNNSAGAIGKYAVPCSCSRSFALNNITYNSTEQTGFCHIPSNPLIEELKSCQMNVFEWIQENILSIMIVSIGISLVELFAMTLSMLLCRNIDPDYDKLVRFQ
ncbi:leukocyte antigen CD37-like [Scyliorhinus canicula]|uniref:leukocyte antigen CD37-like n=1 Tax=Scyliorhinus canicula TaxID=7830 RepID=UPI0018F62277|nr:leukocyte antigen CD37-like [Scyliorhinus canicula]